MVSIRIYYLRLLNGDYTILYKYYKFNNVILNSYRGIKLYMIFFN